MSNGLRFTSMEVLPPALRARIEAQTGKAAAVPAEPQRKYRNQPTVVDSIRFDSKKEARYYEQLKLRQAAGEVWYFLRQVPIYLPGGTRYVIDFLVFFKDPNRLAEYVDVKGRETQVFRLKKREVEHHYPIRILLA
jgi:hypothetical protein